MNKTQSIKQAREYVGEIFAFGDGYKFAVWDETCDAYRETGPYPYHVCKMHRSSTLISVARDAMGLNRYIEYNGGTWTDYLNTGYNWKGGKIKC